MVLIVCESLSVLIILFVEGLKFNFLYFVLINFILNEVLWVINIVFLIYFLNLVNIFLILGVLVNILLVICVRLIMVLDNFLCGLLKCLNLFIILLLCIFIVVNLIILLYWLERFVVFMLNIIYVVFFKLWFVGL